MTYIGFIFKIDLILTIYMEIQGTTFYDTTKISNTLYLIQIALEYYFANNVFKGNLNRVIYASDDYCFRQRLNLLSAIGTPVMKELNLPFMNYFRVGNWFIDDRMGVQGPTSTLKGIIEENLNGINFRFLQTQIIFQCTCWFATDIDAQMAHEALLWIKHPAPKQFYVSGLEYKGTTISIPVHMSIPDRIDFNPSFTENEWLKRNRVFPIKFQTAIRSVVLDQQPQGPESTIFYNDEPPIITKSVLLDFFTYKFSKEYFDEDHTDFEVTGTFNPDYTLDAVAVIDNVTKSSITINWTYNDTIDEPFLDPPDNTEPNPNYGAYTDEVLIVVNGYKEYTTARIDKTYTITGLENESTYNIIVWFFNKNGQVTKTATSGTTSSETSINLKGMIGWK